MEEAIFCEKSDPKECVRALMEFIGDEKREPVCDVMANHRIENVLNRLSEEQELQQVLDSHTDSM